MQLESSSLLKKMSPSCHDCLFKCDTHFTREQLQHRFDHFYSLKPEAQRPYLLSFRSEVVNRRNSNSESPRRPNFAWHINGRRVCLAWMVATFAVGKTYLRNLHKVDRRGQYNIFCEYTMVG